MAETVQEMTTRLYAGMTPEQISAHENWVRRYKLSEEYARVQGEIEFNRRWRELREMSDLELVREALIRHPSPEDAQGALKMLRDAGFERCER